MGWTHRWVCRRRRVRFNPGRMEELWAACLSLCVRNRALSRRRDRMAGGGRRRGGVKQLAGVQSRVDSSHAGLINKMFLLILKMKVHELCISDVLACRS